jgi:voltage-gated potassium channel
VVSVREAQNTDVLRQSGANATIPTAESAGHLMGLSALSPDAGSLMEDLLDSGRGLEVVQRPITRDELGLSPAEIDRTGQLVLAVVRADGVHRFDARDVRVLQNGDELVVIRQSPREQ